MLTRLTPVARTLNHAARLQAVRCMSSHAPAHFKTLREVTIEQKSHMDSMPVPSGSWQEYHGKRNTKWNIMLISSIVLLGITSVVLYQNEVLYLHSAPDLRSIDMTKRS